MEERWKQNWVVPALKFVFIAPVDGNYERLKEMAGVAR